MRREHEVDVPNCQVKFSLNIAATCLLARNEANQPTARDCAPWLPVRPELALRSHHPHLRIFDAAVEAGLRRLAVEGEREVAN